MAFLPELILLAGALAVFVVCLGEGRVRLAKATATGAALGTLLACLVSFRETALLFEGAYRVDLFSQGLKLVFALGFLLVLVIGGELPDIREDAQPEYYLFLTLSVTGLTLLVSCVDLLTLVVALQLASFPLYFLVALRRERDDQRSQMEAVVKYIMFGITATGIMLFGMSYLFGVTGTTSMPTLQARLASLVHSPVVIAGLALMWAGLLYKLAVFPFHFWTPDVYQGGSNETTSLVASLPKLGALAVLVRFVTLATPDHEPLALLLTCLAIASMCYGNVLALVQKDVKRLLGFSGIAHAGYALIGLVTLDPVGHVAALYYLIAYQAMVLACFVVVCRVARTGGNVALGDLAGLHRRSPLLMMTLLVGVFGLAGLPPFAGFMAKLTLLKAALAKGHLTLVIVAVLNTAVAIYYYLALVREACFRDPEGQPEVRLDVPTRALCVALIAGVVLLGVTPTALLEHLGTALATAWGPIGLAGERHSIEPEG